MNKQKVIKLSSKLYRVRLYSNRKSASYETYYAKAHNKDEALAKAVDQLENKGVFSSVHSVDLYE